MHQTEAKVNEVLSADLDRLNAIRKSLFPKAFRSAANVVLVVLTASMAAFMVEPSLPRISTLGLFAIGAIVWTWSILATIVRGELLVVRIKRRHRSLMARHPHLELKRDPATHPPGPTPDGNQYHHSEK